jgi:hypothetical protein
LDAFPNIRLTDEQAKFGTFVDGVKVKTSATVSLKEGDILYLKYNKIPHLVDKENLSFNLARTTPAGSNSLTVH